MNTTPYMKIVIRAVLVLLPAMFASVQAQTVAGTVEFATGQASIKSKSGELRTAKTGTNVQSGDTVETEQGRLHMRMVDGAYISLQPQTTLRLDEYVQADLNTKENALLSLLKGGLRTITGLIGHTDRSKYRLNTSTATIGIRGTEFAVTVDSVTRVNVTEGIVALCNDAGCVDIGAGQSGVASDFERNPVLSFEAASLLPQGPFGLATMVFMQSEVRNQDGSSSVFASKLPTSTIPVQTIPVVPLVSGAGGLTMASTTTGGSFSAGLLGGAVTFATSGELTGFTDCCTPANTYISGVSTDFGADGIIAWGRWTGGLGQGGQNLTTMAYIANLSSNAVTSSSIVRGYASFASTAPTVTNGGTLVSVGTPNSVTGTLNVNFTNLTGGGSLSYLLSIPVAGQTFTINGSANQFSSTGFLGTSSTISSTGSACSTSCTGNIPFGNAIQGVFTGTSAERAGAVYGFNSQIGAVSGAVVFK